MSYQRSISLVESTEEVPPLPVPGAITTDDMNAWHDDLQHDPQYALAKTVLCRTDMNVVLQGRDTKIHDSMIFNTKISTEGEPVTNQLSSGRCWIFAACNVVRIFCARKYGLKSFQLSQSYLFFYDHLAKGNYFLEQIIDTVGEALDSRTVAFLLTNGPAQDGGQWDMVASLIETYGLVPQSTFPESWNSSNSANLDTLLTSKLREMALQLRKVHKTNLQQMSKRKAFSATREVKDSMMREIYRILTITCGTPPKPDEKFLWEFIDKNDKYRKIVTTPLEFASNAGYDVSETVSIINDPRNPYEATYTIERLGNVVGGRPLRYLNMPVDTLAKYAIAILKSDTPVWFGCDVDKASNTDQGFMDVSLFEYSEAFGTVLGMSKKERLLARDSSMTHAMTITGVHLDESGCPIRWRVENSWGPDACNKGFLVMTHEWFENYVFQIVAPRGFVPRNLLDIYDHSHVNNLAPWDVLGACA